MPRASPCTCTSWATGVCVWPSTRSRPRAANGPGPRHHIAHLSMVDAVDAARFGPLGVTANIQGLWAAPDPFLATVVGDERMRHGYPFRTMVDGGADLAMGSDWPVSPPDPWLAIHVAVNRWAPAPPGAPADVPPGGVAGVPPAGAPATLDAEHQALTLAEALGAYTAGSTSLVLGRAGRVRVGERADLAVASTDPFALPAEALVSVRTTVTVVRGEVVFAADAAS
ncbi:amidohydrolase family protein [Microbacterium sp. KR10-403]|uniref:amidohydrolase family protein n=1 Tax=Microbacterium sp. KR10-403 TaxID=3158581 RepID=UPI0032E5002E